MLTYLAIGAIAPSANTFNGTSGMISVSFQHAPSEHAALFAAEHVSLRGARLYIKVDARTRYKIVKHVLDRVPTNVAQRVSFVTD